MTEPTISPEPADQTAPYWREEDGALSTLIFRDDTAATALNDNRPDARWFLPNNTDPPLTWAEALEMLDDLELDLADAIRLTPGGAS